MGQGQGWIRPGRRWVGGGRARYSLIPFLDLIHLPSQAGTELSWPTVAAEAYPRSRDKCLLTPRRSPEAENPPRRYSRNASFTTAFQGFRQDWVVNGCFGLKSPVSPFFLRTSKTYPLPAAMSHDIHFQL